MKNCNVAIVGATGMVGTEMIKILAERNFPVNNLKLLASGRSHGRILRFKNKRIKVENLDQASFKDIDIVLSSAGSAISKRFAPRAIREGAVIIDNTSAFRMDKDVPLVVPEVNAAQINRHQGIIANPNCSTIQLVVALWPLHLKAKIKRIVISTYQSVSGWGKKAVDELIGQTERSLSKEKIRVNRNIIPHQIAFNVVPQIDRFVDNGYTSEEMKLINETRKIMGDSSIEITATAVRVPVVISHSESVNIQTEKKLTPLAARKILSVSSGIKIIDDVAHLKYPLPIQAAGKDSVYVGRIRRDQSIPNGLNLWIVSDNLRKGAALNAIQIAEHLINA